MKTKPARIIWLLFAFLFFFPAKVFAVTVTINNFPNTISAGPFVVDVLISGPNPATNYLRIDLYKEGTDNYFGETYNGTDWYGGSDGSKYWPITIGEDKIATTSVQGKFGNPSLAEYPTPGNYKLRIRRYTSSGSQASGDEQTPVEVQIAVPIATPTTVPTKEPTLAPTSEPTNVPTPKLPTSTPTKKPTPKPTIKIATISGTILGEEATAAAFYPLEASPTAEVVSPEKSGGKKTFWPKIFLGLGMLALFGAAFSLWYTRLR